MKTYNVSKWRQTEMEHGTGLVHTGDTIWSKDSLLDQCDNGTVVDRVRGVSAVCVIYDLDGHCNIAQISGYNERDGMFGYLVRVDDAISRFC